MISSDEDSFLHVSGEELFHFRHQCGWILGDLGIECVAVDDHVRRPLQKGL